MAWVYILEHASGAYYVGSTIHLQERMKHHVGGYTPSTKRLGKMHLVLKQEFPTLQEARKVESKLKKLKRKDYLRKMVKEGYIKLTSG